MHELFIHHYVGNFGWIWEYWIVTCASNGQRIELKKVLSMSEGREKRTREGQLWQETSIEFYYWLARAMYGCSQKANKPLFGLTLMSDFTGMSKRGRDLMHKSGTAMGSTTYDKLKLERLESEQKITRYEFKHDEMKINLNKPRFSMNLT